jgi:hypothetical protein
MIGYTSESDDARSSCPTLLPYFQYHGKCLKHRRRWPVKKALWMVNVENYGVYLLAGRLGAVLHQLANSMLCSKD